MKKAAKITITCVSVGVLALGGVGAYKVVHKKSGPARYDASSPATTPPSDADAEKLARAFLEGWAAGPARYQEAAAGTDTPAAAQAGLRSYRDGLQLSSIALTQAAVSGPTAGSSNGTRVTFTVTAHVRGGTWSYAGRPRRAAQFQRRGSGALGEHRALPEAEGRPDPAGGRPAREEHPGHGSSRTTARPH